ncbi:MAG: YkgJ family cysteine cluster protein [Treponema sp.]|nr:YkgJ family cysteine cluster protein [Treponema sp.]
MSDMPFYSAGLHFSCTRCSDCCRHEGGFVFLSEADLDRLAERFGIEYGEFVQTWCRWVPYTPGRRRLSLREKANLDCIFWQEGSGCLVYEERPLQCKTFPFWDSVTASKSAWDKTAEQCPGMNSGSLHPKDEIDGLLKQLREELIIEQNFGPNGGKS